VGNSGETLAGVKVREWAFRHDHPMLFRLERPGTVGWVLPRSGRHSLAQDKLVSALDEPAARGVTEIEPHEDLGDGLAPTWGEIPGLSTVDVCDRGRILHIHLDRLALLKVDAHAAHTLSPHSFDEERLDVHTGLAVLSWTRLGCTP
jgi:hypothetical protein